MKRLILFQIFSAALALTASAQPNSVPAPAPPVDVWVDQQQEKGFMGIYAEMISPEKASKMGLEHNYGTLVVGVIPNTGAGKAGLQLFDYLYGIDAFRAGKEQNFGVILSKYKPGDKAKIYLIRKGETRTVDLTFGKRPEMMEKKEMNKCEDTFLGVTPDESVDPGSIDGVKISPIKNSTALELSLAPGDVIRTINGYKMYDWDDISYVLDNMKVGETISITYERNGKMQKGSARLRSYAETKKCKDCDCSDLKDMEFDIRVDIPEIRIEVPSTPTPPAPPAPPAVTDVSSLKVDIQDLSGDEVRQLNEKFNARLSSDNTLNVQNLRLSANPAEGNFNLSFNLPQEGNTQVRALNSKGRVIYEYDLGPFSGAFNDAVDISQNGPGIYFLEIKQGNKARVKKILLSM
jgi:hypothetical protein